MVAKILASCPQQCLSLEDYYKRVCPQVGASRFPPPSRGMLALPVNVKMGALSGSQLGKCLLSIPPARCLA